MINNICHSREATLRAESLELLGRMSKKVNLLKEDQLDIQRELADNKTTISSIINSVRDLGNLVDADKLKVRNTRIYLIFIATPSHWSSYIERHFTFEVHIEELDSITSLMTVLRVRLKSSQNKAEVTRDPREKVSSSRWSDLRKVSDFVH